MSKEGYVMKGYCNQGGSQ